ncbi:MAG: hypothetical protein AAFR65_00150 [Pseudomonadota bacterium]
MIVSILVSLLATTAVVNDEFKANCEAYQAEYGGSSDCGCLAKKYDESAELAAALDMITTPEDAASAPAIVGEAIAACAA